MSAVVTEAPRSAVRRSWFWIGVGAFLLVVAIVSLLIGGSRAPGRPLSPANAAPDGARALAEVLRAHGVEVIVPATLAEAVDAAAEPAGTLLLDDPGGLTGPFGDEALEDGADRVVLLEPSGSTLEDFGAPATFAGFVDEPADADCAEGAVRRAGRIAGESVTYRAEGDAAGCWSTADGAARMIVGDGLVVLGTTGALTNEGITAEGNAAFALGLLGATERLVWFQPTLREGWSADWREGGEGVEGPATLGSISPNWVIPVMLLLIAVFLAAAVWRGRRFGSLVVEPLPSIVRADETVRGRARLYARGRARLRAADALRLGTIERIARSLGLPASADVDAIAGSIAALMPIATAEVLRLLRDAEPASDAELIRLSDELHRLETAVAAAARPR